MMVVGFLFFIFNFDEHYCFNVVGLLKNIVLFL